MNVTPETVTFDNREYPISWLVEWKKYLQELLEDHSLLGDRGICKYLNGRNIYLYRDTPYLLNNSYTFIKGMNPEAFFEVNYYGNQGEMTPRRIQLAKDAIAQIDSLINP